MEHQHHHHEIKGKNLFFTILLNLGISIAELIGGIVSGSISLISDAIHNFSDVLSLIISYVANSLAQKNASTKKTFGYKRSEILAAFFNSSTLIILAAYILYEAINRFVNPVKVSSGLVIWLAAASILVNGLSVLFIKTDARESINIKSAYLHLLGDMMTSIAVLIGGILIKYLQTYWIDPLFSILIAFYLIYSSWDIFKTSINIIMQFTPNGLNINEAVAELEKIEGVKNIHHVHIWQLNDRDIFFESHVDVEEDINISEFEKLKKTMDAVLARYNIHHVTLQPEFETDDEKELIHKQ